MSQSLAGIDAPLAAATRIRQGRILAGLALAAMLGAGPLFVPPYLLGLATEVLLFAVFAMSLDMLIGYAGLVSFGHAAFFGLGGYLTAFVARQYTANLLVIIPAVGLGVSLAAALIGLLCLRARGIYFLMLTLAVAQMLFGLAVKWTAVTGGIDGIAGIPRPYLGAGPLQVAFGGNTAFWYLTCAFFLCSYWIMRRITGSPFGYALRGIRDNERRMRTLGYDTQRLTLSIFVIAGVFAGTSGALLAHLHRYASPENLYYVVSGQVMMMVIVGGAGTLIGPTIGAFLVRLVPIYISSYTDRWLTLTGLGFVAFVLFAPRGIVDLVARPRSRPARAGLKGPAGKDSE
jgi:branched-chain amino acid transport system permease protein